jgi:hypothetical protein
MVVVEYGVIGSTLFAIIYVHVRHMRVKVGKKISREKWAAP